VSPGLILPGDDINALDGIGELRRGVEAVLGTADILPRDKVVNDVLGFVYVALVLGVEYPRTAAAMRREMDALIKPDMVNLTTMRATSIAVAAGDPSARR
jgi:hypothetical protein